MNVAIVSPVYKSGDNTDPNSYRPVSVLPCVAKVMEKFMNKQLIGFLNANTILSQVQSGFRYSFSCTTAVVKVMNDIYALLETQQMCAAIFIDLAKAFDTVDHSILLSRLRSIGI